jgi:hypothetical protein
MNRLFVYEEFSFTIKLLSNDRKGVIPNPMFHTEQM